MGKRRSREQIEKDNINYLLNKNADLISRAMEEYDKTLEYENVTGEQSFKMLKVEAEGGRFSFYNKSYSEVVTELTRLHEFMSSTRVSLENARREESNFIEIFKKGNWDKNESPKLLNEDVAKRAYKAYRNIEKYRAAEIVGVGGYGSDNLISYLYSMEIQGKDSQLLGEYILNEFSESVRNKTNEYFFENYYDDEEFVFIPRNVTRSSLRAKKRGDLYDREF